MLPPVIMASESSCPVVSPMRTISDSRTNSIMNRRIPYPVMRMAVWSPIFFWAPWVPKIIRIRVRRAFFADSYS